MHNDLVRRLFMLVNAVTSARHEVVFLGIVKLTGAGEVVVLELGPGGKLVVSLEEAVIDTIDGELLRRWRGNLGVSQVRRVSDLVLKFMRRVIRLTGRGVISGAEYVIVIGPPSATRDELLH